MKTGTVFILEEKFVKIKNQNTQKSNCVINEFLKFWRLYDSIYFTIHEQTIKGLYFKSKIDRTTVAIETYVSDNTLYRYRQKYMMVFNTLWKEHKTIL